MIGQIRGRMRVTRADANPEGSRSGYSYRGGDGYGYGYGHAYGHGGGYGPESADPAKPG